MNFVKYIENLLLEKNNQNNQVKKIAFMEGQSERMVQAAKKFLSFKALKPIMIFENDQQKSEVSLDSLEYIVIGENEALFNKLVDKYVEKRKGKETREQAEENLKKTEYFSAMLVETGEVDGAVGGVIHPTSDILRGAFKSIGPKKGIKTISSLMAMHNNSDTYLFSDISVNVDPTKEQLVDIAKNAYDFADIINFEKKLAFLSFSTDGSAVNEISKKVSDATNDFNNQVNPEHKAIGEVQFDAAYDAEIRKQKWKKDGFEGKPTIFVFPDLNTGNIGYKIAQRMGNWGAIGPIVTGLAKPINDLSRGSTVDDITNTAIITALQSF
ncbi:MAG: phosphotransacetylase [Mycoplasmatales bacterium]|nr:phosphotransacetylase [Mycoplasmatales bacterium]